MESSDSRKSSEDQQASTDSLLKDATKQKSQSTSSSLQSTFIKVLDDIVVRVCEDNDQINDYDKINLDDQSNDKKLDKRNKSDKKRTKQCKNGKKRANQIKRNQNEQLKENKIEQDSKVEIEKNESKNVSDINEIKNDSKQESKNDQIKIIISEDNHPSIEDQYLDDEMNENRNEFILNYWQQSSAIDTNQNDMPVCEKLTVQSMPNITYPNPYKPNQQTDFGLSVLASRSPSQIDVSEIEKQRAAFSDYGHHNELLSKINARSKVARQLRKKSRRESKHQFTLPSGYKVNYSSTNNPNRSYKFNKNKHHYQPPVTFQRSLSCSVAVLNSLSLPSKHHSKRHRDSSESSCNKKPIISSHKKPKLNFAQILTLITLASLAFASQCSMSIIAPFFPLTASEKGVTESISGLVFSIHAFTVMVASPLFGIITPKLGAKRVLLTGILGSSMAIVAFGALDYVHDTNLFIALCFLVRICEALGSCAFSTVSYIYIMNEFSNDVGWAFGLLETFVGLGMSLGPGIGGGLYGLGGYSLPFYLLGVCTFLIFPLACYSLENINQEDINRLTSSKSQNDDSENLIISASSYGSLNASSQFTSSTESSMDQEPLSYWKLIKIPSVLIISLVIIVVSQSQGFLDPTLEPHLRTFGIEPWLVGIVFLAMSTAYAICSPIVGWVASKVKNKFIIMLLGLAITFFGLLLVGPTTIISTNPSIYYSFTGMIIIGIGFAVSFIPTFEAILLVVVKNEGYDDNIITYSIVSGYWGSMFALGETIGPSIGGIALEFLDFVAASTIMAIICFCAVILVVVAVFIGEMNEDESSIESSSSFSTNRSDSSLFNRKKNKLVEARNFQSSLIGTDEEYDENSHLLA